MMKLILLVVFACMSISIFSQTHLFDTLKIDANTRIIGKYPHFDKVKTDKKWNFLIEDSSQIVEFIKNLELGKVTQNVAEIPHFTISVVRNFKEVIQWRVNPLNESIMMHDHKTYQLDLSQLAKFNKQYPFKYDYVVKPFKTEGEYESYLAEQKANPKFLYSYSSDFTFEGSFEIEFPKNEKFPHPKGISEFLEPYIQKIVTKDEYLLGYPLNEKNMLMRNQFTMVIDGPKKLFDELKVDNLKCENWKPNEPKGYFYYKK